jgi:hypothetical protein
MATYGILPAYVMIFPVYTFLYDDRNDIELWGEAFNLYKTGGQKVAVLSLATSALVQPFWTGFLIGSWVFEMIAERAKEATG